MLKGYFITGTDTNVGKTITAAAIVLALQTYYWKPIQSGLNDEISDSLRVKNLTQLPENLFVPTTYDLQASLAPFQAATAENMTIDLQQCPLPSVNGPVIVEGAGGVFVPLNEKKMVMDLIHQLTLPVIIVCRGTLGTINHTLLTIEALRSRQISIKGLVFCGELNKQSQLYIERYADLPTLFHLPYFSTLTHNTLMQWVYEQKAHLLKALL